MFKKHHFHFIFIKCSIFQENFKIQHFYEKNHEICIGSKKKLGSFGKNLRLHIMLSCSSAKSAGIIPGTILGVAAIIAMVLVVAIVAAVLRKRKRLGDNENPSGHEEELNNM